MGVSHGIIFGYCQISASETIAESGAWPDIVLSPILRDCQACAHGRAGAVDSSSRLKVVMAISTTPCTKCGGSCRIFQKDVLLAGMADDTETNFHRKKSSMTIDILGTTSPSTTFK
jgi:hypothetical protein